MASMILLTKHFNSLVWSIYVLVAAGVGVFLGTAEGRSILVLGYISEGY